MNAAHETLPSQQAPVESVDVDWTPPPTGDLSPVTLAEVSHDIQLVKLASTEPVPTDDATDMAVTPLVTTESDESHTVASSEQLGRGHRSNKPSVLLKDFVTSNVHSSSGHSLPLGFSASNSSTTVSGKILYPIAQFLTDSGFQQITLLS